MKVDRSEKEEGETQWAKVYPFDGSPSTVDIYQRYNFTNGNIGDALINWPSIGSVDVETAKQFCSALTEAINIAEEMNKGNC